jgi:hypothetical protein
MSQPKSHKLHNSTIIRKAIAEVDAKTSILVSIPLIRYGTGTY